MKYEFTGKIRNHFGHTLRQIRALRSFGNVHKGEIGGWVQDEKNLSHYGTCWVTDDAKVYENARVLGNAKVFGNSWVFGNACVNKNARVFESARVFGNAIVSDNAMVYGNAKISKNAEVYKNAIISGKSVIKDNSVINHIIKDLDVNGVIRTNYRISYSGVSKTGEYFIRVGCKCYALSVWKDKSKRNLIMRRNNFDIYLEQTFLQILEEIEKKYCSKDLFKKIKENILQMNKEITEHLKSETISLISALPVSNAGPKRDPKTERFLKKSP